MQSGNKYLSDPQGAENNIVELYLTGLDPTKQYYAYQFRQFSYQDIPYQRIDIREVDGEITLARVITTDLSKTINKFETLNNSGIGGYVILSLGTNDTVDKHCVFNNSVVSSLDESPSIKSYLHAGRLESSTEWAYTICDANGVIIGGIRKNGEVEWYYGAPQAVKDYLQNIIIPPIYDAIAEKVDLKENYGLTRLQYNQDVGSAEFAYTIIGSNHQIIMGVRKDGTWYIPTLIKDQIRTHWYGKSWYAYGTSETNINAEGQYAKFVQKLSGMVLTNKGISGGAISGTPNSNIKNAVFDDTDGKDTADIITLECLANDLGATFGEVTDTGNDTFLGNLAQCIVHLQQVTTATIVVMISTLPRYDLRKPNVTFPPTKTYHGLTQADMADKMRKMCEMYGVYFINPNIALGFYRMTDEYIKDNIHHTELGGLVYGKYIWSKIENLPTFDTIVNI